MKLILDEGILFFLAESTFLDKHTQYGELFKIVVKLIIHFLSVDLIVY